MARHWGINLEGGIGRAIGGLLTPMRVADAVLKSHPDFPGIKTFRCAPMCADITPTTCATNYSANRYAACTGCQIGALAAQDSLKPARAPLGSGQRDPVPVAPHCIRCGKTSAGDTRSIGRVRFVNKGTECVSCFNRKSEVAKGSNSKHATPKLWAALRQATITYETGGKVRTVDIGLRSSRHECERYVTHVHPGATLIEVVIDGVAVPPFAGEYPLYHGRELPDVCPPKPESFYTFASKPEKPKAAPRKRAKPLPVSAATDEDGDEFGYRMPAPVKPKAKTDRPSQSRVGRLRKNAAEETLADFGFGVEDELLDFVHWLADGWPQSMPREPVKRRRGRKLTDIMGQRFGKLTAMMHVGSNERGDSLWRCACDCGDTVVTRGDMLRAGESKSCGCSRRKSAKPSETADFGFGGEEWNTPLHKIAKTVTAESEHSDADGNGCARRSGWPPPLSEADDLEYRRSFDEDEAAEAMESVAEPKALPEPVEPVSEAVSEPEPAREPELEEWEVRPLSRRERRTYAKAEKRLVKKAQREARAATGQPPSIASTCRAVIAVGHALYERRK